VKVEFFVNGTKVGEKLAQPYTFSWTPPGVGVYNVQARVEDNLGARDSSATVSVNVQPNPNQAPVVTLSSPANNATVNGSATTLQANLSDPEGDAITVTFYGRQTTPAVPAPDFTLVAIPDTQYYSEGAAARANTVTVEQLIGTFGAQTQWCVDNRTTRNIAFVSHMGDIVENGNFGGNPIQWERASAAMANLENPLTTLLAHGIPYGLAPGNHDMDPIGAYDTGSTAFFNQYFNLTRFAGRGYWGGNYGTDNTNNYQLFSAGGLDFIVIHFAYDTSPNQAILDWADALLKAHPHRRAICTSHYIIGQGNPASFGTQGAAIYNNLKDNPNLFLLLCGHIHAEGRRSDVFEGRTVYSVLSDYQGLANGGQGLLRTFTFSPANSRIRVESWSPTQNRAASVSDGLPHFDGTFDLAYNMQAPLTNWVALGTVNVPAGGTTASVNWTGLSANKDYEWYAAASDTINVASSTTRRFSTATGTPPTVALDSPTTGATFSSPANISFTATAADSDGTVARVEFYNAGTKIGEDDTAPYEFTWEAVAAGSYAVNAVAVDDTGLVTLSNVASITVELGDHLPTVALIAPVAGTVLQAPATVTLSANAADNEGPVAKVEFFSGTLTHVL
ncbi:MAG: Ig-like domain-containing protein, partial [Roseimicrobium sp.]